MKGGDRRPGEEPLVTVDEDDDDDDDDDEDEVSLTLASPSLRRSDARKAGASTTACGPETA